MADEIRELTRDPIEGGRLSFRVIYFYELAAPITTHGGVVVKLTPRAGLPPEVAALEILSEPAMAALDTGDAVFRTESVKQGPDQTHDDVLKVAQRRYAKGPRWIARERARYANTGRKHNAT